MGKSKPLDRVRKRMATHMERSHAEVVPVTVFEEVDINDWDLEKTDITVRLIQALIAGCKKEPIINAHYHGSSKTQEYHDGVHVGIAMDTEHGLFAPTIRHADTKTPGDLREALNTLKNKARTGTLVIEDLEGATITLSNFGMIAGIHATPIIIPPQVTILGVGRIYPKVVLVKGVAEEHSFLSLSFTFDHRVITGGEATRCLKAIKDDLELREESTEKIARPKTATTFEIPYIQYLDKNGQPQPDFPEKLKDKDFLTTLYRKMTLARMFDERVVALVRENKVAFHASSRGEEAVGIGYVSAMGRSDVLVVPYRHYPAEICRGDEHDAVDMMMRVMLYWNGDERGNDFQGASEEDLPRCVTVGLHCSHAVGVALALKGEGRAVVCALGDGATSQGDFPEALNAAGVGRLPVVFIISNNQWAISTPRSLQTRAETLAQKAIFGGIKHCVQVDGNDVVAVYSAARKALLRARKGRGPSVIEAITYRLSSHTTVDKASRYRHPDEVKEAEKEEPLLRMKLFLESIGCWSELKQAELEAWCEGLIGEAVDNYLNMPERAPEAIFGHLHAELPRALKRQRQEVIENARERR